jgi:DNA-binding NarL/FixJ family response regulator
MHFLSEGPGLKVQILVIDDHPLVHEILPGLLLKALPGTVVSSALTLEQGIASASRHPGPDLVFVDLGLPGCTGLQAFVRFRKSLPRVRVVVFSANDDRRTIFAAMDRGAAGYIPKTHTPDMILAAVRGLAAGHTYVPEAAIHDGRAASTGRSRYRSELGARLTDRQLDVLRLMASGLNNGRIARRLSIAENTVKQHTKAVFAALGVSSRAAAVAAAHRHGVGGG